MFSISRINLTRSYVARAILMPGARPRKAELPRNITQRAYGHSPSSQREVAGCNGNFAPAPRYIKIPRNPRSHCFTLIHETGTCQAHCNRIVFAFLATYSCAKILNHVTGIMQLVRYYVKNILSHERIRRFVHPPAAPAVSMSRHHNRII